jgi:putative ABC transport system ATP-binding protein
MPVRAEKPDALITLRGLRVVRGARGEDPFILEVPEIDVPRGLFTTILGESGCGKTTLLLILGLMRGFEEEDFSIECEELTYGLAGSPSRGPSQTHHVYKQLKPDGTGHALDLEQRERLRRDLVGFCLQGGELIPSLSLMDNVAIPRLLSGLEEPRQRAIERLKELGLESRIGDLPGQLSGGQRQRGIFARALIHSPPLVVLDEPTSSLDRITAESAISILRSQTQELGQTVVMVTHDKQLADRFSDFLITMDVKGHRSGTVTRQEWRGSRIADEQAATLDASSKAGRTPLSVTEPPPTREDENPGDSPGILTHIRLGLMDALGPIYGVISEDLPRRRPEFLWQMRRTRDYAFFLQSVKNALVIVAIGLLMLLLRGMRSGLIEDFREDLTKSPTARELVITPLITTGSLTEESLTQLVADHPEIETVIPSNTHVAFPTPKEERDRSITLVGTLPDDPKLRVLFADQDFSGFDRDAVVLPEPVAREMNAEVGSTVTLWITRATDQEGVEKEVQPAVLKVSNLIPEARGRTAYIHLDFAGEIADFKAGRPVVARGWTGRPQPVGPRYAAFLLFAKSALSGRETTALESRGLTIEKLPVDGSATPLAGRMLTGDEILERGMPLPHRYRLLSGRQEGDLRWLDEAIWNTENLLTDCDGILMPWNEPIEALLDGDRVALVGLSATVRWLRRYLVFRDGVFPRREKRWLLAHGDRSGRAEPLMLEVNLSGQSVRLPVQVVGRAIESPEPSSQVPAVAVPAPLLAHLIMAGMGMAEPDTALGMFRAVAPEREYYRARVFVQDVYQVVDTHEKLSHDFAVRSEQARVKEVQRYRTILDYLVNVLSAISVLVAFAIVWIVFHDVSERKKRMIGTLRIMGLTRRGVVLLLLAQGLLVAAIAVALLAILGSGSSLLLNLIVGKNACALTASDILGVTLAILGVCLLGTYIPARAASLVDPVVALEQAQQQG